MTLCIEQLRCVFCGKNQLVDKTDSTVCGSCSHIYPKFGNEVFIGNYTCTDTLGLIEITSKVSSNANPTSIRENHIKDEAELKTEFEAMFGQVAGVTKATTFGSQAMAKSVRVREWGAFELLTKEIDFNGKLCFENGAGLGADCLRMKEKGAEVVCLDFNPMSVRNGSQIVPEAQWICGNSECLPFVDDVFDISVAKAALHHMHDVEGSVREMIRVTKPGGFVILVSDPFMNEKNERQREMEELQIFDKHPMVLGGVNENVIPFNRYRKGIENAEKSVLLTMKIHNNDDIGDQPTFWEMDEESLGFLNKNRGNISSRLQVSEATIPAACCDQEEIPTKQLFEAIGNPQESISVLLPYLPEDVFDTFPHQEKRKFNLLNGWHATQNYDSEWRNGYCRARIYLTSSNLQNKRFEVRRLQNASELAVSYYWSINGKRHGEIAVEPGQTKEFLIAPDIELRARNVIEIGIADENENKGAMWRPFNDNNAFAVRMIEG